MWPFNYVKEKPATYYGYTEPKTLEEGSTTYWPTDLIDMFTIKTGDTYAMRKAKMAHNNRGRPAGETTSLYDVPLEQRR